MGKTFNRRCRLGALLALSLLPWMMSAYPAAVTPAAGAVKAKGKSITAILLRARGVVEDPNFAGSIVVVMNNAGPAPVGIIINRPMPLLVSRFFPKLPGLGRLQNRMYYGGPVGFPDVWYLFRADAAQTKAIRVCKGVYASADRKRLLRLLARKRPMQGLRIFLGHAGWAPGQLQAEIEGGAWAPQRADAQAIFHPRALRPWPPPRGARRGT